MAESKTKKIVTSVKAFINAIENDKRREDAKQILVLFKKITKQTPVIWGTAIVGFGSYHYVYASGLEGDSLKIGFSPRKANIVLYLMNGPNEYPELLNKLGKYKTGKSCLYINKIEDVDLKILERMIKKSYQYMTKKYG